WWSSTARWHCTAAASVWTYLTWPLACSMWRCCRSAWTRASSSSSSSSSRAAQYARHQCSRRHLPQRLRRCC
ncbi:hypothetical protein COO60DRAFT_1499953, partial [Scenedesmus sp. NREL 46B-D3]